MVSCLCLLRNNKNMKSRFFLFAIFLGMITLSCKKDINIELSSTTWEVEKIKPCTEPLLLGQFRLQS